MKKIILLLLLFVIFDTCKSQSLRNGDIIFHTSKSSQSKMIQIITNSELTHCGIIFLKNGKPYVLEAVNTVKYTSLEQWINRGVGKKYKLCRIKNNLTSPQISDMFRYGKSQIGKKYDVQFKWSDSRMYCSELVYKVFIAGDQFIGEPKIFSDYNLNHKLVKKEISKRYPHKINLNEPVIAPVDIIKSDNVRVIFSNY